MTVEAWYYVGLLLAGLAIISICAAPAVLAGSMARTEFDRNGIRSRAFLSSGTWNWAGVDALALRPLRDDESNDIVAWRIDMRQGHRLRELGGCAFPTDEQAQTALEQIGRVPAACRVEEAHPSFSLLRGALFGTAGLAGWAAAAATATFVLPDAVRSALDDGALPDTPFALLGTVWDMATALELLGLFALVFSIMGLLRGAEIGARRSRPIHKVGAEIHTRSLS
jgi:hypothetical protein